MLSIERQFVRTERPLYSHLVSLLEAAIAKGELPSGTRVPPERTLAQQLKISRTTVVSAYRELESRGLLRGYVGRGTFVCAAPEPEGTPFAWRGKISAAALRTSDSTLRDLVRNSSDARLLSLAAGEPALDKFPNEAFIEAVNHVLATDANAAWGHGPTEGQPALRNAIADRYGVPRESVLVLSGAQQGMDLLARCLIDPGDAVIMDRPGYLGAIQSFRAAGAKLMGWDLARADSDELEDLLVRYRPKLIYTNPTFNNPTGTTLPIRARREVLSLAQRYRVPIVEDATYRDLYFTDAPPPSLRELDDHNIVIYLNSFSKVMAPGLRLGWIAAAPSIVDQIAIIKQR
ncbi:MAG TPA: PLP-dependent aminotransferase family protein, partial [Vicinamibacterales bacterium]|nr:PLP-dependent aminotransferase family protein [Vicinamibacterales bacterium]